MLLRRQRGLELSAVAARDEIPPKDIRAGLLKEAFDSVVDDLPAANPYRIPLQKMRDQAIAKIK
jgi:hypothetical protein